jgi:hypothetical protein
MVKGFIARADRTVVLAVVALALFAMLAVLLVAAQGAAPAFVSAGKGFV